MSDASTGLLALALAVISASAFSLIMKFSHEKQYSVLAVGGVNYIAAAIAAALLVPWEHVTSVSSGMCLLAAVSGIGYLVTYLLLAHALPRRGITVPTAAVQVAMVVPLVPSVLLWHEHVSAVQATGVLFAVAAILLLAPPDGARATGISPWAYLVVPMIFLTSGATRVAQKAVTEFAPDAQQPALTLIWFATAAIFSLGMMQLTGWPTRAGEWIAGVCLGCANLGCLVFLLRALSLLPAVVAFPAFSSLSIVLVSATAFLLWHERHAWRACVGIVMGILSVVLIGLR